MTTMLSFAKAELGQHKPKTIREEIRKALRVESLWEEIEPLMQPPGKQGSKEYDHAIVVDRLLQWDAKHNKSTIAGFGLTPRLLWDHVYAVLGSVFLTGRGRIIGLLENKRSDEEAAAAASSEPGDSVE